VVVGEAAKTREPPEVIAGWRWRFQLQMEYWRGRLLKGKTEGGALREYGLIFYDRFAYMLESPEDP
jgi:hypothetical protein